MIQCICYT